MKWAAILILAAIAIVPVAGAEQTTGPTITVELVRNPDVGLQARGELRDLGPRPAKPAPCKRCTSRARWR